MEQNNLFLGLHNLAKERGWFAGSRGLDGARVLPTFEGRCRVMAIMTGISADAQPVAAPQAQAATQVQAVAYPARASTVISVGAVTNVAWLGTLLM